MRRCLVIGLGEDSRPTLEHTQKSFATANAANDLRTLWITSENPVDTDLNTLTLSLTHKNLTQLYYQPEVRAWSGPNWREWKEQLAYNRLYGKLALYWHRRRVGEHIIALINEINRDDSQRLNLYLVASLTDPFASGALLDMAYLLHRTALARSGRVYGILLVPDTFHKLSTGEAGIDPQEELRANWRYAVAYAALRELNFVQSAWSFYQSQHPEPVFRIEETHVSPFQTGDCYLVGGHLDQARRAIDLNALLEQTGDWIALHTLTPFADYISVSEANRGLVSSFGIVAGPARIMDNRDTRLNEMTQCILDYMLRNPNEGNETALRVDRWFSLPETNIRVDEFVELLSQPPRQTTVSPFALRLSNRARHELDERDAIFAKAVRILHEQETQLAQHIQTQQQTMLETIDEELTAWRDRYEGTFPSIIALHTYIIQQADKILRAGRTQLNQIEQETSTAARLMKDYRSQFLYIGKGYPFTQTLAIPALLIVILVAAALYIAAQPIALLAWLLLSLTLPITLIIQLQNQHFRRVRRNFIDAQTLFLNQQRQLMMTSIHSAYQQRLLDGLERKLSIPNDSTSHTTNNLRIEHISTACRTLLSQLTDTDITPSPAVEEQITPLLPEIANQTSTRLWELEQKEHPLTPDHVQRVIANIIEHHLRIELESNEKDHLDQLVATQTEHALTLLATNDTRIDERLRQPTQKIIGLEGWSKQTISEMAGEQYNNAVRLFDLTSEEETETYRVWREGTMQERWFVTLHLRNNIPLQAILDLNQWQMAYQNMCYVPELQQMQRCFLHPTRAGIATPDIMLPQASEFEHLPLVIMAFVVLLRFSNQIKLEQDLCRATGVPGDPRANFDELCGALAENPDLVFQTDLRDWLNPRMDADLAQLREVWQELMNPKPRFSETYADWEVWTIEQIDALLARRSAPRSLYALAQIVEKLVITPEEIRSKRAQYSGVMR
ncbi:MAG: hypothetical protein JXA10_09820 [Anaerolineae bacterium]|nr:hypothetical protein [Anaerolineae bacterium]